MSIDMRKLIESIELVEKIGNLSQLNVGWMIDILKQDKYHGVTRQFTRRSYSALGNTSEVVDVGPVKNIAGIRKAMRTIEFKSHEHATAQAFALHIDNQPVLFAVVDADDLRTKRQSARFAYDLSMFKDMIQAKYDREKEDRTKWPRPTPPGPTSSQRDVERDDYDYQTREYKKITKKFAGVDDDVESLVTKVNEIFELAQEAGKTVTMKIASSDRVGVERGQQRRNAREVAFGVAETLADRLKKYKNSKRPTAQNVEEFVRMALNKEARVINFAGGTYSSDVAQGGWNSKIEVADLMRGKPFTIEFKSQNPNRKYDSFKLHMRYANGQLMPWQATYSDENRDTVTEPLDLEYWTKVNWKVNIDDKDQMMRAMLSSIKENPDARNFRKVLTTVKHMKRNGYDWPELDILAKSAQQELNK